MLAKCKAVGITGSTLAWIRSFLQNRTQRVLLEGSGSQWTPVLSGVPQGSVLGPLLFLIFINNIADDLTDGTSCRLFTDDCLLYRSIRNEQDNRILQNDLTSLEKWENDWCMNFNPTKCKCLRVPAGRKVFEFDYRVHGEALEIVKHEKYLGVYFSFDMKWNKHVDYILGKAYRNLGFIKRNLYHCNSVTKERAYFALVRPGLEYASSLWDPSTKLLTKKIEKVQRNAIRFVTSNYIREEGIVSGLLRDRRWISLESRRRIGRMNFIRKMLRNDVCARVDDFFIKKVSSTRSNNKYSLFKSR